MESLKFAVMVDGKQTPSKVYETYTLAEEEAKRLARSERRTTYILKIVALVELSDVKVTIL